MRPSDNLARNENYTAEYFSQHQLKKQQNQYESMPAAKQKKKITSIEVLVISVFVALIVGAIVTMLTIGNINASLNREIQNVNRQSQETEIVNENLQQNVQELSRYDRVYEIARKNGLELNEENIRNVAP